MTHYLLDANALLRFFRKDITRQAEEVAGLFVQAKQSAITITIPLAAILETVFVLLKVYGEQKELIGSRLFAVASNPMITVESREIVKQALLIWKSEAISFVDCLVFAQAQREWKELFTFDKKLKRLAKQAKKRGD